MSMPRTNIVKVDLSDNLQRFERGVLLASADKAANKFGAEVYQDGKAASLTGYTVVGYFIRTGVDTITINGTVEGNKAYVVLPESCYYQDGGFTLSVKLRKSGYEQTLAIFDGFIAQTITNRIIDGANAVPFVETVLKRCCHNLLTNSDFQNPMNQQRQTSYSGLKYMIDGWKGSPCELAVNDGSITVGKGSQSYGILAQFTPFLTAGKTYTLAAKNAAGEIVTLTFAPEVTMPNLQATFATAGHTIIARHSSNSNMYFVGVATTSDEPLNLVWIALYEGAYTLATLPTYIPKDRACEMMECYRYSYQSPPSGNIQGYGIVSATLTNALIAIVLPVPMRVTPSIKVTTLGQIRAGGVSLNVVELTVNRMDNNVVMLTAKCSGNLPANHTATLVNASFELDAKL